MTPDAPPAIETPRKQSHLARLHVRLPAVGILGWGLSSCFLLIFLFVMSDSGWGTRRWLWIGGAQRTRTVASSPESPLHIDPLINPIILLGLPKSGSEAIHNFLQCLHPAWKSQHYCCDGSNRTQFACPRQTSTCGHCIHDNWSHGRPALEHCGGGGDSDVHIYAQIDVETQEPFEWFLPQHFALPLLERDYPNAVWILNTRGDDNNGDGASRWARNILHWHSTTLRLFHTFDLDYYNPTQSSLDETNVRSVLNDGGVTEQDLMIQLEQSYQRARDVSEHERRHQELQSVYHQHSSRVRDFARNYHHRGLFLEINVDNVKEPPYLKLARGLGFRTAEYAIKAKECWKYDADALDNDWMDLTLKV